MSTLLNYKNQKPFLKDHLKNKNSNGIHKILNLFTRNILLWVTSVGDGFLFFKDSLFSFFKRPYRISEMIQHMEFIGNKSLPVILLSSSFTGMALTYQIYLGFTKIGTTGLVGPTVAFGIFKELGPVLTGIILSARAGGAMAAQIGKMKISEQLDALEVMGIDSKEYLVGPRIVASFIAAPLLCGIFDFTSIFSASLFGTYIIGLDSTIFWNKIQYLLNFRDVLEGLIKSSFFGLIFSSICSYRGFFARKGAKGVGEATNKGVVHSMTYIILIDFFLTRMIKSIYSIFFDS